MGGRGRKDSRGNNQQTFGVETNIHGEDLHETDKNERTHKTVAEVHQKSSKNRHWFFESSHNIQKVSHFLPKLGRMGYDRIGLEGTNEGGT